MLPTKFQFIWESGFRGEDFLEINQSETRMACGEFESHPGEEFLIQHYVIKLVSDLGQVGGFLWVHRFPPPLTLTSTI
jgi:hypothetical protein